MINILIDECDFEIVNLYYKKIHYTVVNKYCTFKDQNQLSLFFFLVINKYVPFIELNNLIKTLLSLHCQLVPQNTRTDFASFLHTDFY